MKAMDIVMNNDRDVLTYLKGRLPVFHLSNIFFRDIQYGIQAYLKDRRVHVGYGSAEDIAWRFVAKLEQEKILRPIDRQTWMVHKEEFRTPPAKPVPAAKAS